MTVGFTGAPGNDFVGFVENGPYRDSVRATWTVDDNGGYISNGHLDDHFGWHGFYELFSDILNDGKKGKKLEITEFDGGPITLSLETAAMPFSQFQLCFSQLAIKADVPNSYPGPANAAQSKRMLA